MKVIRLRLSADSREDCEIAIQYLSSATGGIAKMGKPRKGRKNGANGGETWLAYGELDLDERNRRKGVPL